MGLENHWIDPQIRNRDCQTTEAHATDSLILVDGNIGDLLCSRVSIRSASPANAPLSSGRPGTIAADWTLTVSQACQCVGLARSAWYRPLVDWRERDRERIETLSEMAEQKPGLQRARRLIVWRFHKWAPRLILWDAITGYAPHGWRQKLPCRWL